MINLVQNSTIHGLNHIVSASNRYFKTLWILLFTLGIGGISINIVFIAMKFVSNPVGVSQTVNYENFTWPDLTFCNPSSPYDLSKRNSSVQHWQTIDRLSETLVKDANKWTETTMMYFNKKAGQRYFTMSTANSYKLYVNDYFSLIYSIYYGLTYVDSFLERHDVVDEINFSDSREIFLSNENVQIQTNIPCHTLHVEKSQTLKRQQIEYLSIKLNLNLDPMQFYSKSFPYKSIFLYLSNEDYIKGHNRILLEPDYKNIISISQTRYRKNGVRYRCRKEKFTVELYDAMFHSSKVFEGNYKDCLRVTKQRRFVQKCNCYSPFLPIYKNESGFPHLCFNMSLYSISELKRNFLCLFRKIPTRLIKKKDLMPECDQFQYPKCDETIYKVEHLKENVEKPESDTGDQSDAIKVDVIIRKDSQHVDLFEEELQYPFSQFLSDIGGLMGLWLGLSVIGLFEIIEFLHAYINIKCQCCRGMRPHEPRVVEYPLI